MYLLFLLEGLQATQWYNASILEDLVLTENHNLKKSFFEKNQHLREAFVLMRVWLKQRELNEVSIIIFTINSKIFGKFPIKKPFKLPFLLWLIVHRMVS